MNRPMRQIAPVLIFLLCFMASNAYANTCEGRFVNPITDICWECSFPITIGAVPIIDSSIPDTPAIDSPVCVCADPIPRAGVATGFWEPARLIDVSRAPGCFVNLGGLEVSLGSVRQGKTGGNSGGKDDSFFHAHYYHYPVWTILGALIDAGCLDAGGTFDIAWVSELDPLWNDEQLAAIIAPEAILFANVLAQAACAADCVAASFGLPLQALFWCAGCQGGMYPLTGSVSNHVGGVQASLLTAERVMFKMHRQLIAWGTYGTAGLCSRYPMPIMDKAQYRFQMVNPTPQTAEAFACNPTGRSTVHYEGLGGEYPIAGESWGYLVWRKRNCCVL